MKNKVLKNLVITAMLFAVGLVLPFLTGQIPAIGKMLLPMHIPVMLCGLICGAKYGLAMGFLLPIVRSLIFVMPVMYPTAVSMAFELATYGFVIGLLFARAKWKCVRSLYKCLLCSMLAGRVVLGVAEAILLGFGESGFAIGSFLTTAFVNAIPGIVVQLTVIPCIMLALGRTHIVHFSKSKEAIHDRHCDKTYN